MAGLGPWPTDQLLHLRQVAHLSGRVPVLEGLESSQLAPHPPGRPEELTTTDWSYSSPKPEAAPGRLHLATVLPAPGTLRPPQATASQAVTTTLWSYFFFFFFASNSSAKNIEAGRRSQVCGGGASLSPRVLSRTWQLFLLDLDVRTDGTNQRLMMRAEETSRGTWSTLHEAGGGRWGARGVGGRGGRWGRASGGEFGEGASPPPPSRLPTQHSLQLHVLWPL